MMKISGEKVAEGILKKLAAEIKYKNLQPKLAIILAGSDPASKIYVNNKIKAAKKVGIKAQLFEFSKQHKDKCLKTIQRLDQDAKVHGIIVQYPVYDIWDFEQLEQSISPQKDVDGFREDSPYDGATALGVWEMLTAFAFLEGFKKTENFLKRKKIVLVGKGKAAGGPTFKLLISRGFKVDVVEKDTRNPKEIIKKGDVVISATGVKNIINQNNLKRKAYVVGVGFGDLNEDEVSQIAKLYNPNIGGIGPLTIACLLKNVVKSAKGAAN